LFCYKSYRGLFPDRFWGHRPRASTRGVQPLSHCVICISFSTCSSEVLFSRLYEALADELTEFLAACRLRCMCSVTEGCKLRVKYTALAIEHILPDGRLVSVSPRVYPSFQTCQLPACQHTWHAPLWPANCPQPYWSDLRRLGDHLHRRNVMAPRGSDKQV